MTSRKASLRAIASLCDEIGPEDGIDPRLLARGSSRKSKKEHRKTLQLRRQAEVAIQLVLDELGDDGLQGLAVTRVETDTNAGRLIVLLRPTSAESTTHEVEALEALARASGVLRSAVAFAIHRKRAPILTFRLVPWQGRHG